MTFTVILFATLVAMASSQTAVDEFAAGNNKFTARLYKEVVKANPKENFVFSPLSIEIILALTRAGAKGQTEAEFSPALNLPSQQRTQEALQSLLPSLKINTDLLKLLTANKLYLGKNLQILPTFKNISTNIFDAGIENVDFNNSVQAAGIINNWVESQTNNRIKNLIDSRSLDASVRLILINTLYFSGKWIFPFKGTKKEKFYISNTQTKEVDMMHVFDRFRYYECFICKAKFVELPYLYIKQNTSISMIVVLPNERDGLSALENMIEGVLTPKNLQAARVNISLPRFLVESSLGLKPILQNLGLKTVFTNAANLSGISKEPLKVADVIQKAFINVTETGTEAAAATAVVNVVLSALIGPVQTFRADHPFLYFIKFNNIVLFAGRVVV